jgi:hypothetical protein
MVPTGTPIQEIAAKTNAVFLQRRLIRKYARKHIMAATTTAMPISVKSGTH